MAEDLAAELPRDETLHCLTCGRRSPCHPERMLRYIRDDALWPRCCGARMVVSFAEPDPPPAGG